MRGPLTAPTQSLASCSAMMSGSLLRMSAAAASSAATTGRSGPARDQTVAVGPQQVVRHRPDGDAGRGRDGRRDGAGERRRRGRCRPGPGTSTAGRGPGRAACTRAGARRGDGVPALGHRRVVRLDHDVARRGGSRPQEREPGRVAADDAQARGRRTQVDLAHCGVGDAAPALGLDPVVVRRRRVAEPGQGQHRLGRARRGLGLLQPPDPQVRPLRRGQDAVGAGGPGRRRGDGEGRRGHRDGARAAREGGGGGGQSGRREPEQESRGGQGRDDPPSTGSRSAPHPHRAIQSSVQPGCCRHSCLLRRIWEDP